MRSTTTIITTILAAAGTALANGEAAVVFYKDAACTDAYGPAGQVSLHAENGGKSAAVGCAQPPSGANHLAAYGKGCDTRFFSDSGCRNNLFTASVPDSGCYSGVNSYYVLCASTN